MSFSSGFVLAARKMKGNYGKIFALGGMTERLKVTVLKTVVVKATVGSNPTPSAGHLRK
jgi:hypothetical protein